MNAREALPRKTTDEDAAGDEEHELDELVDQQAATAGAHHDIAQVAKAGIAGPGQELPHRAALEQSFGVDLGGVRAHVGGPAGGAASALGAEAYTVGDQVGFAKPPDVATAAHEAAHVVQNRAAPSPTAGLTAPAGAQEQHADRVADRAASGESAASLVSAAPQGTGAVARKPAPVKAPADAAAAMTEITAQIDAGIPKPERIALLAGMLSSADKATVRDNHWDVIEQKCTAAQTITIAELLDLATIETVRIGVQKKASAAHLAGPLRRLDTDDLQLLAEDATLFPAIQKLLPGPVIMHLPQLEPYTAAGESVELMKWFVDTTPAFQIWRTIEGASNKERLASTFDTGKLWDWTKLLPANGMTLEDVSNLRGYAAVAKDPEAVTRLTALADAGPQSLPLPANPTEADYAAKSAHDKKLHAAGKTELETLLADKAELTFDKLIAATAHAAFEARSVLLSPANKKRITAKLDADQMAAIAIKAAMTPAEQIEWLLDHKKSGPAQLWFPLNQLSGDDLKRTLGTHARLVELHARLSGDVPNLAIAMRLRDADLLKLALADDLLAKWLLGAAMPEDIFRFVVLGANAEEISKACKYVAKDRGYAWVYELGNYETSSGDLRRLQLALPDRAAAKHLQTFALRDFALPHGVEAGPQAPPPGTLDSPDQQIATAVKSDDGGDIAENAAELSDGERAAVRGDRALVKDAIKSSAASANLGSEAVRTARELDGNLSETLLAVEKEAGSVDKGAFRTYARERSAAEHVAVASDPKLAALAEKLLNYSVFNALPGLAAPASLATALAANSKLIDWIAGRTHPVEALERLGNVAVAEAAAKALELHGVGLVKRLPMGGLTQDQKAALMRIAAHATKQDLHDAASDRLDVDPDNDRSADTDLLNAKTSLRERIDEMRGANAKNKPVRVVDTTLVQAVCNSRPRAEVLDVLAEKGSERIKFLRDHLGVSPLTVFPWLAEKPGPEVFANRHFLDWMLATEEAVAVLRTIGQVPASIGKVAAAIENAESGAMRWLGRLPSGFGLSDADEATLFALYKEVTSDAGAIAVFAARFGHHPDGEWTRSGLNKMWTTLARLPDRQVEGNAKFGGLKLGGERDGVGGSYSPSTGVITIAGEDTTSGESRYDRAQWQSKAQIAAHLGVDETEIDRRVGKSIETQVVKGVTMYRFKVDSAEDFTYTLLHEAGHAVDAMLGNRTELVFGQAGWKTYSGGDFDQWADEMGAFDGAKVSADDRAEIRTVFEQYLQSSSAIEGPGNLDKLVTSEHPLKKNAGAFISKTVKKTARAFTHRKPIENNGRMFTINNYYGKFMSYDPKIVDILPLPYAGFAPEEFFAECYVEYYRDTGLKGGNLPVWIKTWFDANVDRVGHGPVKKP